VDWSVAVPVRRVDVPGAGDSPGARMSTREKAPPMTVTAPDVFGWMAELSTSLTVIVWLPLLYSFAVKTTRPFTRVVSAGMVAKLSVEANAIRSFTPLTKFQY